MDIIAPPSSAAAALLGDFSMEMTGKDFDKLAGARHAIPAGTRVNVTHLGNEDLGLRLVAARAARESGFVPVPHIAARRLTSENALREFLSGLRDYDATEHVLVVGGDPARPEGPFDDALAVIRSGLLNEHGVRTVSISGYPEGHPDIPDPVLWTALEHKHAALKEQALAAEVITQFGFDVDPVLTWVEKCRQYGIDVPIRVGVPGPAGVRRLLTYASRFGVGTSASIARKYGLSITNLMSTAGPDRFLQSLAEGYRRERHGELKLHFYTFGGLQVTSDWITEFRKKWA
jgi:methylenetetrahydrofolate reductase (NADPH)